MNPMDIEEEYGVYEGGGDANSLMIILGWLLFAYVFFKAVEIFKLHNRVAMRLLATIHASPILFLLMSGKANIGIIWLSFVLWLSFKGMSFVLEK